MTYVTYESLKHEQLTPWSLQTEWIQNMLRRLQAILIARLSQSFQTWHKAVLAEDQKDIAKELPVSYDFQAAHQDFPSIEF